MNPTLTTLIVVIIAAVFIEAVGKYFRRIFSRNYRCDTNVGREWRLPYLDEYAKGRSTLSVDQFLFGSIVTITQQQMMIIDFISSCRSGIIRDFP